MLTDPAADAPQGFDFDATILQIDGGGSQWALVDADGAVFALIAETGLFMPDGGPHADFIQRGGNQRS